MKASLGCGGGAEIGEGGVSRELSNPVGGVRRTGGLCSGKEKRRRDVFSLGWSRLPSVFLVGAHFFYCGFMSFVFRGCY